MRQAFALYVSRMHLLLALALFVLAPPSLADDGLRVIDGDGLHLNGVSIRLWGMDAVELRQHCQRDGLPYSCGQAARDALLALVDGKTIACEEVNTDRYQRVVARCQVDGVDLGGEMVRQGWAVDFKRYSKGRYAGEQAEAKAAGRGLWDGTFELPGKWRKQHR